MADSKTKAISVATLIDHFDFVQETGDKEALNRMIRTAEISRPGFELAAKPSQAKPLYEYFNQQLAHYGVPVETGVFGADMKVELCNDGPVTIMLDSKEW